jgi:hypothetical protein
MHACRATCIAEWDFNGGFLDGFGAEFSAAQVRFGVCGVPFGKIGGR